MTNVITNAEIARYELWYPFGEGPRSLEVWDKERIALLVPTRGRPQQLAEFISSVEKNTRYLEKLELLLFIDSDDLLTIESLKRLKPTPFPTRCLISERTATMGVMANTMASLAIQTCGLLMGAADDYRFATKDWDEAIREPFRRYPDRIVLVYPLDHLTPNLATLPILSAEWVVAAGQNSTSYFPFWYDDVWLDEVGQLIGRKERAAFAVEMQGGKGKTSRMQNLPFWQNFYINLLPERLAMAEKLRAAIYKQNAEENPYNAVLGELMSRKLKLEHRKSVAELTASERELAEPIETDANSTVRYLAAEGRAVNRLLDLLQTYLKTQNFFEAQQIIFNLALSSFALRALPALEEFCSRSLEGKPRSETDEAAFERLLREASMLIGKEQPVTIPIVVESPSRASTTATKLNESNIRDHLESTKLLSIICHGRNDGYMGNFSWRLATALNNFARNLKLLGAQHEVEVLFADWGSETPFYKTLELTPEARQFTKFLVVPEEIARKYDQDSRYSAAHPPNLLARRARGKHLFFCDSDTFLTTDALAKLLHHLRIGHFHNCSVDDTFFWASKLHVPFDFVKENPVIERVDEHIERHWQTYAREEVSKQQFVGCSVGLLIKKQLLLETSGFDERLIYWGWSDIEWHIRAIARFGWDDLDLHGLRMFHLEHYSNRANYTVENPRKLNPQVYPTAFAPNPEDWGLRDVPLQFCDGYGLRIPPTSDAGVDDCPAREQVRFKTERPPASVRTILNTVPIYRAALEQLPPAHILAFPHQPDFEELAVKLHPTTVATVGTWLGAGAHFLAKFPFIRQIFCIDHWDRNRIENYIPGSHPEQLLNNLYEQFLSNSIHENATDKIYPIRLASTEAAAYCARHNLFFDLIYLDADRSPLGMKRDIIDWMLLLTPGGILAGSEWSHSVDQNFTGSIEALAQAKNYQFFGCGSFWLLIPKDVPKQVSAQT